MTSLYLQIRPIRLKMKFSIMNFRQHQPLHIPTVNHTVGCSIVPGCFLFAFVFFCIEKHREISQRYLIYTDFSTDLVSSMTT